MGVVAVQMDVVRSEVVHDGARLRRGAEADGGPVAVEAQVSIVGDDVDGRAAPCGLVCGRLASPHVIDSADVASVEADSGPRSKHLFPCRVRLGH